MSVPPIIILTTANLYLSPLASRNIETQQTLASHHPQKTTQCAYGMSARACRSTSSAGIQPVLTSFDGAVVVVVAQHTNAACCILRAQIGV